MTLKPDLLTTRETPDPVSNNRGNGCGELNKRLSEEFESSGKQDVYDTLTPKREFYYYCERLNATQNGTLLTK